MYQKIINELQTFSDPAFAQWAKPFLNITTDSDEIVLGVRTPILRKLAKKYKEINYNDLKKLIQNNTHEMRALGVFIMLLKVKKEPQKICEMYLKNLNWINNWDLIDYSAPYIVAPNITITKLRELAHSNYLWANRVAMISTLHYIRLNDFDLTLEFAKIFMKHPHHLMHKASGWMLREIGKRDVNVLINFLEEYSTSMPAIMRSYAKEKIK